MQAIDRAMMAQSMMTMRGAVLERNATLRAAAEALRADAPAQPVEQRPADFRTALHGAMAQVNNAQAASSEMTAAYERGETTDIAAVMMARQRASVGFEATLQVRNKLLSAYQDIMNMPL